LRCRLPEADVVRWLAMFVGAGSVLTAVWGSLRAGQIFAFHSQFNFALLFAVLILMAIGLAPLLPRRRLLGTSVNADRAIGSAVRGCGAEFQFHPGFS